VVVLVNPGLCGGWSTGLTHDCVVVLVEPRTVVVVLGNQGQSVVVLVNPGLCGCTG